MAWQYLIVLCLTYLIGSFPIGWIVVWLVKRKDIRYHASGRMGTSNVIRTVGVRWGIITAIGDILKGVLAVWVVRWSFSERLDWLMAVAGVLAVLGHTRSIFLIETRPDGKVRLRGGAGGLTSLGVVIGLWPPVIFFAGIPAIILYFTLGYASLATFSINFFAMLTFMIMRLRGIEPCSWWYVAYGLFGLLIVSIVLTPNFKRLRIGKERVMKFSLQAILKKKRAAAEADKVIVPEEELGVMADEESDTPEG